VGQNPPHNPKIKLALGDGDGAVGSTRVQKTYGPGPPRAGIQDAFANGAADVVLAMVEPMTSIR